MSHSVHLRTFYPTSQERIRSWTKQKSWCYNLDVLAYLLYAFLCGFALFLLGFSVFMYFEGRKFGDNQFTVKLLPPPPRLTVEAALLRPAFAEVVIDSKEPAFAEVENASTVFIRVA